MLSRSYWSAPAVVLALLLCALQLCVAQSQVRRLLLPVKAPRSRDFNAERMLTTRARPPLHRRHRQPTLHTLSFRYPHLRQGP